MRNRRRAAEGRRATSTVRYILESEGVVDAAEPCGEGLRTDDMTNVPDVEDFAGCRPPRGVKSSEASEAPVHTDTILTMIDCRRF